ncbi:PTS sugar transporter subunit IIB [Clostridium intestinale]|jgi:PTS system cellobiose-specific IIB component|uniref:PTS sugar transporter subunit IIB n=1 Tax=Clostridium intestinale TaxID=36845 RepID=UPI0036F37D52
MRIMLACCAGISTSLVVTKMQEAAKEQGKEYKIWAVDQKQIEEELGNFDVLLLGPQIRHVLRKATKIVGDMAPIAIIDSRAYGRCDGEAVLEQAESLVGGK